jgi:hypothetical protein
MEKHIPGIFNYCDRWCERCAFTSKCGSFAMDERLKEDGNANDRVNQQTFWERFNSIMEQTNFSDNADDVLFDDLGIEDTEESLLSEESFDYEDNESEKTYENFLFKAAHSYSDEAGAWIKEYEKNILELAGCDEGKPISDRVGSIQFINEDLHADAIEVVERYAFFITGKLARAISGYADEFEEISVDSDANGSAKIALIAISRSITAWSIIRSIYKDDDGRTAVLLGQLIYIRRAVEQLFPRAMEFIRPGFDTH